MIRVSKVMRVVGLLGALIAVSGCSVFNPEGFEVGGKIGLYAVHEREVQESTSTKPRPFICSIRNCDANGNVVK